MYEGPPSLEKEPEIIMPTLDEIKQALKELPSLEKEPEIMPTLDEIKQVLKELPHSFEQKPEHIPTVEEIKWVLEELLKGKNYSVVRCLKDSEGVYLFEAKTRYKSTAEILEYVYTRKGHYENFPKGTETGIDIVYYKDEDAYKEANVEYADIVAKNIDGNWKIQANGNWEDL